MTDQQFFLVWFLSFALYLVIYTWWIPIRTRKNIEAWLMDSESDETLLASLEVITTKIREQLLVDFEEFMLPQARDSFKNFWNGAMGNAAQELAKTEEGGQLSIMHGLADSLKNESWFVQAAASKLIPLITKAAESKPDATSTALKGLGLGK